MCPLDLDALRNKKNRRSMRGWSPKDGVNLIRILPHTMEYFTGTTTDFAYEFRSHFLKGENIDPETVRCLREDNKKECPFCGLSRQWKDSTNPAQKKIADDIRAGERHLMNILHLTDIGSGVQSYETGPKVYDLIMAFAANPGWGDLFSLEEGRNIELTLTPQSRSKSQFNEYQVIPQPVKTNIRANLPEGWEAKIDLLKEQICAFPTQEQVDRWMNHFTKAPLAAMAVGVGGGGYTHTAEPAPAPSVPHPSGPVVSAPPVSLYPPTPASPNPPAPTTLMGVEEFVEKHPGRSLALKGPKKHPLVPDCFSEGGAKKEVLGYNPRIYPCEDGCPVRVPCQLTQLDLEA